MHTIGRTASLGFVTLVTVALAACSTASTPAPSVAAATAAASPAASSAASAAAGPAAVTIVNLSFQPASITVKTGTQITWTNNDSVGHTVTLDDNSVDSNTIDPGKTFQHAFSAAGSFTYHCKI